MDATNPELGEKAGDVVDRYELIDKVGEGGMGTVWRARQEQPVKREVALKIIKLGMDTREVVVRFEAERQALALMDHPFIAKVLDGGATANGRPYFVMELVQGIPITDYCDRNQLGLRDRIELMVHVCEAVQHAHQKGVIHRDLKPSNVLVAELDGIPIPQVIDFGIAKATSAELTEKTFMTQEAQIIGTPEYMAPEQADMTSSDIDTRADVYSLGVLLYELLTGYRPFDLRALLEKGYMELLRTIREDDPVRPSTRVTTRHASDASTASTDSNTQLLSKRLRGDLDWIVMKALEKERDRRYDSATSLALDLERHLRMEPVEAAPPSAAYRMRKFVRRRKGTVITVAAITMLLIGGSIGTGWGWWEAHERGLELETALGEKSQALAAESEALAAESLALAEKSEALVAESNALVAESEARAHAEAQQAIAKDERDRAKRAEEQAVQRASELEKVTDFQRSRLDHVDVPGMAAVIRETLMQQIPEERRSEAESMLEGVNMITVAFNVMRDSILGPTQLAIETEFKDDTVTQAFLLQHLARSMQQLGISRDAVDAQERALALMKSEKVLGGDHVMNSLLLASSQALSLGDIDLAEEQAQEALDMVYADIADRPREKFSAESAMGAILMSKGEYQEALEHLNRADDLAKLHLKEDAHEVLVMRNTMALTLMHLGSYEEAEEISLGVLAILEACGEPCTLDWNIARARLANIYSTRGDDMKAIPIYESSLEYIRSAIGDTHHQTLMLMRDLGSAYLGRQRWSDAQPILESALEGFTDLNGEDHLDTLVTRERLGRVLAGTGKRSRASEELKAVHAALSEKLGVDHNVTSEARSSLVKVLLDRGRYKEAEPLLQLSLQSRIDRFGEDDAAVFVIRNNIGYSLEKQEKFDEAEAAYRAAYEALNRTLGPMHRNTLTSLGNVGIMLHTQKKYEEAIPILEESLAGKQEIMGASHAQTLAVHWPLAQCLQATGRLEEACEAWALLKEEAERSDGVDSPRKVTATYSLATCLKRVSRMQESQAEILDCWKSVRQHLGEKHEYSMLILNQVVTVFELQYDYEGALPWLEKQLELRETMSTNAHPYTVGCRANLAIGLQNVGRQADALPLIEEAKDQVLAAFGPTEEATIQVHLHYTESARANGQAEAGTKAMQDLVTALRGNDKVEDAWTAWAIVNLGSHLISAGQFDEAEAAFQEARTLAGDAWPGDSWHARELQSLTGVLHMHRGRFADAERELLAAAEWMFTSESMPTLGETTSRGHPRMAMERLLELYAAWDEADPNQNHTEAIATWTENRETWMTNPER
tara:strand:- start:60023 stop:63904 length:3882 start_codon:yes stop_codon:yes gene_type:complete